MGTSGLGVRTGRYLPGGGGDRGGDWGNWGQGHPRTRPEDPLFAVHFLPQTTSSRDSHLTDREGVLRVDSAGSHSQTHRPAPSLHPRPDQGQGTCFSHHTALGRRLVKFALSIRTEQHGTISRHILSCSVNTCDFPMDGSEQCSDTPHGQDSHPSPLVGGCSQREDAHSCVTCLVINKRVELQALCLPSPSDRCQCPHKVVQQGTARRHARQVAPRDRESSRLWAQVSKLS